MTLYNFSYTLSNFAQGILMELIMIFFLKLVFSLVLFAQSQLSQAKDLTNTAEVRLAVALQKAQKIETENLLALQVLSEPHSEKLSKVLEELSIPPQRVLQIKAPVQAMATFKTIIIGSAFVNEVPVDVLRFVIAHELGHLVKKHAHQKVSFLVKNFPDADLDALEVSSHKVTSAMMHQVEYEADKFAKDFLSHRGLYDPLLPAKVFMFISGFNQSTRTHPSHFDRMNALQ